MQWILIRDRRPGTCPGAGPALLPCSCPAAPERGAAVGRTVSGTRSLPRRSTLQTSRAKSAPRVLRRVACIGGSMQGQVGGDQNGLCILSLEQL